MAAEKKKINRRDFFRTASSAGLASVLFSGAGCAESNEPEAVEQESGEQGKYPQVPRAVLGKTGVEVSVLALGGLVDFRENQIVLKKALEWGVNYWDTAESYNGGNSEVGIGEFFAANPEVRKDVFLVSKTHDRKPAKMQKALDGSLERLKTDYVDLYYMHGVSEGEEFTDEVRDWAQQAKASGKIRHLGLSTHKNMANVLQAASKVAWIDVVMTVYNFRQMQNPEMEKGVQMCSDAGIGLVAMKTQARGQRVESDAEKKLIDHFLKTGFTVEQAKLRAVWGDERFTVICSQIGNIAILVANVAAALDKTKLAEVDVKALGEFAQATCSGYCANCSNICAGAVDGGSYISEVMRCLMYYNSYGEKEMARKVFAGLPIEAKKSLAGADYKRAEKLCPQNLAIGELVNEAFVKLA